MINDTSFLMHFFCHPYDSLATFFRSLSTGLPSKKIAEYDADILNMVAEGKADVYLSADDAMNDIFGTHDIYSNRTKSN